MKKREYIVISTLVLLIIALWFIKTSLDQNLMVKDYDYVLAQEKIKELNTQNMLLEEKVDEQTSYTTVEQKAKAMGFE